MNRSAHHDRTRRHLPIAYAAMNLVELRWVGGGLLPIAYAAMNFIILCALLPLALPIAYAAMNTLEMMMCT